MNYPAVTLTPEMASYPRVLQTMLGEQAPQSITAIGNSDVLRQPMLALLCSVACPGDVILQLYDLARVLRDVGVTIISGFQSPMEVECQWLLLRGEQPLVVCPARSSTGMRLPTELRVPMDTGRLLILSPFAATVKRKTAVLARTRNRFVAALADAVLIAYAAPGGQLATLAQEVATWNKPLLTLASPYNDALLAQGAQTVAPADLKEWWPPK